MQIRMLLKRTMALVVFAGMTPVIHAGWPEFWHASNIDKQRNNVWPQPFRSMDAGAVQAPFDVMRSNGWRLQNTLSTHMFDENNALTDAGGLHLQWVVTQTPTNRRAVFVMQGSTAEATAARVESVEVAVSSLVPTGSLPQIFVTDTEPYPSPGQYQMAINRAMNSTIPKPRLQNFKSLNAPSNLTTAPNTSGKK